MSPISSPPPSSPTSSSSPSSTSNAHSVSSPTTPPSRSALASEPPTKTAKVISPSKLAKLEAWHRKLGHAPLETIRAITGEEWDGFSKINCHHCNAGALKERPFHRRKERSLTPGEVIHSDAFSTSTPGFGRELYGLVMVDEASLLPALKLAPTMQEIVDSAPTLLRSCATLFGRSARKLVSDKGSETQNSAMQAEMDDLGTSDGSHAPHTPQQSPLAENTIGRLWAKTRILMASASHLSLRFWSFAIRNATLLYTVLPSRTLGGRSPYEIVFGKKYPVASLIPFGSTVYVSNKQPSGKLDDRGLRGTYLGRSTYEPNSSHLVLLDEPNRSTYRVVEAAHVQKVIIHTASGTTDAMGDPVVHFGYRQVSSNDEIDDLTAAPASLEGLLTLQLDLPVASPASNPPTQGTQDSKHVAASPVETPRSASPSLKSDDPARPFSPQQSLSTAATPQSNASADSKLTSESTGPPTYSPCPSPRLSHINAVAEPTSPDSPEVKEASDDLKIIDTAPVVPMASSRYPVRSTRSVPVSVSTKGDLIFGKYSALIHTHRSFSAS